jgi:hypothetical protein
VPNFAFVIGYTNASWTLRADIVNQRVCRLLNHMAARGYATATPEQPEKPQVLHPVLDLQAGYVRRGADQIPLQGESDPWRAHQNYPRELVTLRHGRLDDDAMVFGR